MTTGQKQESQKDFTQQNNINCVKLTDLISSIPNWHAEMIKARLYTEICNKIRWKFIFTNTFPAITVTSDAYIENFSFLNCRSSRGFTDNIYKTNVKIMNWYINMLITSFLRTSGAKYSGVPQNVLVVSVGNNPSFERPKSVSTTCPCESSSRFSGFRSR